MNKGLAWKTLIVALLSYLFMLTAYLGILPSAPGGVWRLNNHNSHLSVHRYSSSEILTQALGALPGRSRAGRAAHMGTSKNWCISTVHMRKTVIVCGLSVCRFIRMVVFRCAYKAKGARHFIEYFKSDVLVG